jgi:hypothetical protein
MRLLYLTTTQPLPNEIIIYRQGLSSARGRYIGDGFVHNDNGHVDQFDRWRPVKPGYVTMRVQHPYKRCKIECRGKVVDGVFVGEGGVTIQIKTFDNE